ncbi:MAG: hypothetical protein ASARMPREDX12_006936 [Alectoria sarmentosa]|nr:MAG: hypothetical protein ASARMPREDX12_006936 [Alectoria sarmentosa]
MALPAEIQSIITSHLIQFRDLNHLCCTCKAWSEVVLPALYHTVELKVPLKFDRLPSLENLLASSSGRFKYTRCLRIVTKQYPLEDDVYENGGNVPATDGEESEDDPTDEEGVVTDTEEEEDDVDGVFKIYLPNKWASSALNALIRVLIARLSPQQLHSFSQYSGPWKKADLEKIEMDGLKTFCIPDLDAHGDWPFDLVAKNHKSLRHLQIGTESDLALEYANKGHLDKDETARSELTGTLAESMKRKFDSINESFSSNPPLRLESLSLIGLDVNVLATATVEPIIDFSSLGMLTLESCVGLEATFPLLMGSGAGRPKAKSKLRLHTFAIRNENNTDEFSKELETFLLSLEPLTNLHVLTEGTYAKAIDMRKVFEVHGKRLCSLICDDRDGPRLDLQGDTTLFAENHEHVKLIAEHCTGLKALGISLDWKDIAGSRNNHKKIASSFSKLKHLQTLNVRNLPAANATETWLPEEYMLEGLGTMLLNIITKKTRIDRVPVLKTLALGASTYSNVRMGVSHYPPSKASTFLPLRIYHVNYDCRYQNSLSPKLHLIARGTPADAWGNAENLDIFRLCWLDGAPQGSETEA